MTDDDETIAELRRLNFELRLQRSYLVIATFAAVASAVVLVLIAVGTVQIELKL